MFVCLLSDSFPGLWTHGGSRGGSFPILDLLFLSRSRLIGSTWICPFVCWKTSVASFGQLSAREFCLPATLRRSAEPGPQVCVACYRYMAIVVCIGSNPTLESGALLNDSVRVWVLRLNEHSIVDACVDDELIDSLRGARAVRALLTSIAFAGFMTFDSV